MNMNCTLHGKIKRLYIVTDESNTRVGTFIVKMFKKSNTSKHLAAQSMKCV